ncbi:MAG: AAA family ATPase [Gemmatimonadota bacterium]
MDDETRNRIDAVEEVLRGEDWSEETAHNVARSLVPLSEGARTLLARRLLGDTQQSERGEQPKLLPPRSPGEILSEPQTEIRWVAEGIIPAGGNFLLVGYPKSFKTYLHMELAVAGATGTPFLGRFAMPGGIRTGLVLLEGGEREQASRIHRLALSRNIGAEDLNDYVHVWHRPPLKLSDPVVMWELGAYAKDLELDLLMVDPWAYASEGSSNEDRTVTSQLLAISRLRDQAPGLTTSLTHHARKGRADPRGDRLTDLIRGSGSFGGWYDVCMVLGRKEKRLPLSPSGRNSEITRPPTLSPSR